MAIKTVPSHPDLSHADASAELPNAAIVLEDPKDAHDFDASSTVTAGSSSSSSSSDNDDSENDRHTTISFGTVQIREYERIVGDHPDTKVGVPLALGWNYLQLDPQELDAYEETRTSKGILRMSSITRKNILREVFGIPEEELRNAEKEVQRIRKRREFSNKQSKVGAKTETAVRGFGRKIRRSFTAKNFLRGLSVASSGMVAPAGISAS